MLLALRINSCTHHYLGLGTVVSAGGGKAHENLRVSRHRNKITPSSLEKVAVVSIPLLSPPERRYQDQLDRSPAFFGTICHPGGGPGSCFFSNDESTRLRNCTVDPNQTWTDPKQPKSPIEEECKSQLFGLLNFWWWW